jgi:hypothetical protein
LTNQWARISADIYATENLSEGNSFGKSLVFDLLDLIALANLDIWSASELLDPSTNVSHCHERIERNDDANISISFPFPVPAASITSCEQTRQAKFEICKVRKSPEMILPNTHAQSMRMKEHKAMERRKERKEIRKAKT